MEKDSTLSCSNESSGRTTEREGERERERKREKVTIVRREGKKIRNIK